MIPIQAKEFLTVNEVAVLLSCSINTVYQLIKTSKLKAIRLTKIQYRIKRTDIDKLFTIETPVVEVFDSSFDVSNWYNYIDLSLKYNLTKAQVRKLAKK